jgi:hypothetical protein
VPLTADSGRCGYPEHNHAESGRLRPGICFDDLVDLEAARIAATCNGQPAAPDPTGIVGVAANVRDVIWPLNGLRHPPEGDTCGWYIWAGEDLSQDPGFFSPLHVAHLSEWCPAVLPYMSLAPGWRFVIAPGYEDVWFDPSLLTPRA